MLIDAAAIHAIVSSAAPGGDEVCGVLLGRRAPLRVAEVVAGLNVDPAPGERYLLDAATLLRADTLARAAGREVVGFYHTHPRGPAVPSRADRALMWPGYVYLIAATAATRPYLCAWVLWRGVLRVETIGT